MCHVILASPGMVRVFSISTLLLMCSVILAASSMHCSSTLSGVSLQSWYRTPRPGLSQCPSGRG